MSVWDDDITLIDDLKILHAEGWSFSQMAERLGHGLSRNACIGKAKRLGLERRAAWGERDPDNPKRRAKARHSNLHDPGRRRLVDRGNNFFALRPDDDDDDRPVRELPADAIPLLQRKSFAELKPWHCRFIYGDPKHADFFYCGGDKYAGAYCAYHHAITHRGQALLSEAERERRRQFRINAHRIAMEEERLAAV